MVRGPPAGVKGKALHHLEGGRSHPGGRGRSCSRRSENGQILSVLCEQDPRPLLTAWMWAPEEEGSQGAVGSRPSRGGWSRRRQEGGRRGPFARRGGGSGGRGGLCTRLPSSDVRWTTDAQSAVRHGISSTATVFQAGTGEQLREEEKWGAELRPPCSGPP